MGAFLEKPKTEKTVSSGEGYGLRYGLSAMQGWRMEMEDSHVHETQFKLKNYSFFGVFDGHAGPKVSLYSSQHILDCILTQLQEKLKKDEKDFNSASEDDIEAYIQEAITQGFLKLDSNLRDDPQWANGEDHSGTTAITVMISPTKIIFANCGDSRGFLCRSGKVEMATEDHKPYSQIEKARIEKAGGTVMMQRVNGSLAVSRALGDFDYKKNTHLSPEEQLVSPLPDVTCIPRDNSSDEFLLLACDGIYDVMANEEVLTFVRHRLSLMSDLEQICSDLIDLCLHKNSRDNMSVVLVVFPAAPQVSQEAIDKEKQLQQEAKKKVEERLGELVNNASDPLEIEENYVVQQLATEFGESFDIHTIKPHITEKLAELSKERFGNDNPSAGDFTGPSDPEHSPFNNNDSGFVINTEQGGIKISSIMMPQEDTLLLESNNNYPMEEEEEGEGDKKQETKKSEEEGEKMEVTENVSDKSQEPSEVAT